MENDEVKEVVEEVKEEDKTVETDTNNSSKKNNQKPIDIDKALNEILPQNLREILKGISKKKELSQAEIDEIKKRAEEELKLAEVLDTVEISSPMKRAILVDGDEELFYDNGEFFLSDSVDATKGKKKITRKKAIEIYVEYFIKYILNPMINEKNTQELSKSLSERMQKEANEKLTQREVKQAEQVEPAPNDIQKAKEAHEDIER